VCVQVKKRIDNKCVFSFFNRHDQDSSRAVLDCETTPHYWMTVVAQDHGIVTLSIEVSSSPQVSFLCFTSENIIQGEK
jgi:hypothetical protein